MCFLTWRCFVMVIMVMFPCELVGKGLLLSDCLWGLIPLGKKI